jgi:hypothetical protein
LLTRRFQPLATPLEPLRMVPQFALSRRFGRRAVQRKNQIAPPHLAQLPIVRGELDLQALAPIQIAAPVLWSVAVAALVAVLGA